MLFSLTILFAAAGVFASYFAASWKLIGLYFENRGGASFPRGVVALHGIERLGGADVNGFVDTCRVFHSHFYKAAVSMNGAPRQAVFVRYFPDAFGRPLRNLLRGKQIKWWREPDMRGVQLSHDRFLVWPVG